MGQATALILVLLGAPGSGKGTLAAYIKSNWVAKHLSTGNLLREEISRKTELGLKAKEKMDAGKLVPDETVNEIVGNRIVEGVNSGQLVILDGYPRKISQAEFLDSMENGTLRDKIRVLELEVSSDVVVERISKRQTCAACGETYGPDVSECRCGGTLIRRDDDKPEAVIRRLKTYEENTRPVAKYYEDTGRRFKISGVGTHLEVEERVDKVLKDMGIDKIGNK